MILYLKKKETRIGLLPVEGQMKENNPQKERQTQVQWKSGHFNVFELKDTEFQEGKVINNVKRQKYPQHICKEGLLT